eukprot:3885307-Rhodomonas_salina.1
MFNGKRKDFKIYSRLLSAWAKQCGGSCWVLHQDSKDFDDAIKSFDGDWVSYVEKVNEPLSRLLDSETGSRRQPRAPEIKKMMEDVFDSISHHVPKHDLTSSQSFVEDACITFDLFGHASKTAGGEVGMQSTTALATSAMVGAVIQVEDGAGATRALDGAQGKRRNKKYKGKSKNYDPLHGMSLKTMLTKTSRQIKAEDELEQLKNNLLEQARSRSKQAQATLRALKHARSRPCKNKQG